jgi:hypothetical protein
VLWSTSRPTILVTRSKTISPILADASSIARWRAVATSAVAVAWMRAYSAGAPRSSPGRFGLQLVRGRLGALDDLAGLVPRPGEDLGALVTGGGGLGARFVGRLQRGTDLLLAGFHGLVDRRQEVLRDDEQNRGEDQQFDEERAVGEEED